MSEDDSDSDRAAELSAQIRAHNEAYHSRDNPSVSDAEFDALLRELIAIETRRPDLVVEDSPTRAVGAQPSQMFAPVEHDLPMMSLENAMDFEELEACLLYTSPSPRD